MGQPIVRYESGQTSYPFEAMTDSGDSITFSASFSPISKASGYESVLSPYGIASGGAISPGTGDDSVDVASLTAAMAASPGADSEGVVSIGSGSVSVSRASGDTHMITSVTVDNSGALVPIAGTEGTAFNDVRGSAGGPPYIPVDSIEIGQVRTNSQAAAEIAKTEIFTVPGLHREMSNSPTVNTVDYANGTLDFSSALPPIHTGDAPKLVYVKGATPIFANIGYSTDWSPAKPTFSVTSTDTYDGAVGDTTSSLGSATFTALLDNGVSDGIVAVEGNDIWVEYRPDRDKTLPKQLTQGKLSSTWTQAASAQRVNAAFTVAASTETVNITS